MIRVSSNGEEPKTLAKTDKATHWKMKSLQLSNKRREINFITVPRSIQNIQTWQFNINHVKYITL
jgi:hypothetical protein